MMNEFGKFKLFISIFMPVGLEPFPHRDDKCELVYNMRSFRPTDLVLLSSTIVRGSC